MPKIILLTGPSGSGKTTVAKHFLTLQTQKYAYINQDDVRQFVKVGYKTADGERKNWNAEIQNQWNASIPVCIDIAKRYFEFGINCLIDFYSTHEEFASVWVKYLKNTEHRLFILMPDQKTVIKRNDKREYPSKLSKKKIIECYKDFQDWQGSKFGTFIDNSQMSITETVDAIVANK